MKKTRTERESFISRSESGAEPPTDYVYKGSTTSVHRVSRNGGVFVEIVSVFFILFLF